MNARMNNRLYDSTKKLHALREVRAEKEARDFEAAEKTGFLKVGNGKIVHLSNNSENRTLCSAEGNGGAQARTAISGLKIVNGPVTCKRCIKMVKS